MGSKGANFTKQKLDDIMRFGTEELFKEDCKDNHDFKSVEAKSYHQEKSEDHLARRGQFRSRVLRHHFQQKQEGMSRQELSQGVLEDKPQTKQTYIFWTK